MLPYSSTKSTSWEVKARSHTCSETEAAFEEGEILMSRLRMDPGGLVREDYKKSVWNRDKQKDSLFYWKTQYRLPPPKKEDAFKEENAEETLRQLVDEKDESAVNTIFILAVMLERKRIFIERGVQRDAEGRQIRIYEHKESGETFLIPDPELTLDQIESVQEEVALKLGWIKPEGEAPVVEKEIEKVNLLFLSADNACRSQIAEGWTRSLKQDLITVYSAGVDTEDIHPHAIKVMAEVDIDISGQSSKHINDFKEVPVDIMVTLCDHAHETCPWFPEEGKVVHVGFEDPLRLALAVAEDGGSEEEQLEFYRIVRDDIRKFVEGLPDNLTEASAS